MVDGHMFSYLSLCLMENLGQVGYRFVPTYQHMFDFFFANTLIESCFWSCWLQSPGVRWEMHVSGREQVPWYLYQHVHTANSGLLMPCIWNSRFLSLQIFLDRLCPSGIFYQKYRHNDIQSNYVFCMAIVSFTEWSSKFLFHRKRSKKFPDRNALLFSDFMHCGWKWFLIVFLIHSVKCYCFLLINLLDMY